MHSDFGTVSRHGRRRKGQDARRDLPPFTV
jgi:hypothetical protein